MTANGVVKIVLLGDELGKSVDLRSLSENSLALGSRE